MQRTHSGDAWTIDALRSNIIGADTLVPVLDGSRRAYVFLDNGASTPSFRSALDVLDEFMEFYSGVHRGTGFKSLLSTRAFDDAHNIAGNFVGADPDSSVVLFGKNSTEVINKLANRCDWREGDVVIVSLMEHHSNDLPWRKHARVVHIGVDDEGYLDMEALHRAFETHRGHVRFLAVTGASNITGIINPVHELAELAHREGALCFVDAAQLAPHRAIDMLPPADPRHIDFLAYSAHKMYAPFGIGVLVGPKEWFTRGEPDMVGGGVVEIVEEDFVAWSPPPAKEEAGSPNVPGAIALASAIQVLESVGMAAIEAHERALLAYAIPKMQEVPGLTLIGPTSEAELPGKVGVLCFMIDGMPHAKVAAILGIERAIGVRNGCFCAHPYVKRLMRVPENVARRITEEIIAGDRTNLPGLVRASFGCYNSFEDVDRLVDALHMIARGDYAGNYVLDPRSGTFWPEGFSYSFPDYFPHFPFLGTYTPRACGEAG